MSDLDKIKKAVAKLSETIDCEKRKLTELNLVLEELFANVVCHGFKDKREHDIELFLTCKNDSALQIRMEDDGEPFDPTSAAEPDTRCAIEKRCVGGLGIHFVKHFIDACEYYRKDGKNIVVLKKQMPKDEQ